jgi:hypothetical protein
MKKGGFKPLQGFWVLLKNFGNTKKTTTFARKISKK